VRLRHWLLALDIALAAAADVVVDFLARSQRFGRDDFFVVALGGFQAGRANVGGSSTANAVRAVLVVADFSFADDLAVDISREV
jgi:hypothetical protein